MPGESKWLSLMLRSSVESRGSLSTPISPNVCLNAPVYTGQMSRERSQGDTAGPAGYTGGTIIVSDTSTGFPPRSLDIYIFLRALVILRPLMNNLLWGE